MTANWWRRQAIKAKKQRQLNDLKWVLAAEPPPFSVGPRRLKGGPARGKAYENKLNKHLTALVKSGDLKGDLFIGPWFKFEDAAGAGLAQPDALLICSDYILVIEAKLKQTTAAYPQIRLYGELASKLFGKPWLGVQVFRWPSLRRGASTQETIEALHKATQNIDFLLKSTTIYDICWLG